MKRLPLAAFVALSLSAAAASPALATTYPVTTTSDLGDSNPGNDICDETGAPTGCSLRAAIEEANAHANSGNPSGFADQISFAIGTGPQTISPATVLPDITDTVVIEGNTQTGFAATPLITVKGLGTNSIDGLTVAAGGDSSQISRLVLNNFKNAIRVDAPAQIDGNYIGIAQDGTQGVDAENDIGIRSTATSGGVGDVAGAATDRNVISGNTTGILVAQNGASFQIFNNYVGLNPAGTGKIPNGIGVQIAAGADGEILTGNVISGNDSDGVQWNGSTGFVSGSRIGTNAAGTSSLSNGGSGVDVTNGGPNLSVGLISGNHDGGIRVSGAGAPFIFGNKIGVGADGVTPIPNTSQGGISVASSGVTIGGLNLGQGNLIANNAPWGIQILSGTGNEIRGDNSITGNSGLGIDLDPLGFNPNNVDPDFGQPNLGQNYPLITSAVAGGSAGLTLTSQAGRAYRVELFKNTTCDPSFYGEGQTFIGSATSTSNGSGVAGFSVPLPGSVAVGDVLTATATDTVAGNTSEFSLCRTVTASGGGGAGGGGGGGGGGGQGGTTTQANGEPDSNITRVRTQKASKLKRFSGTASDPEGQLAAVEIAVVAVQGGAKATARRVKRCINLQSNGRLKRKKAGKRGRCAPAKFLRAKGTTKWTYKLKRKLRKGKYVVYARAVDTAGKKETRFSKADRNRAAFRLR